MSEDEDFEELDLDLEENLSTKNQDRVYNKDQQIKLLLRSTIGPGEREETISTSPSIPIIDLKQNIAEMFGLNASDFHLSLKGRTLDIDDVLSNYDVETEGTNECLIIPVSQAGNNQERNMF